MNERVYKYAGFISYSQKDARWARRLHRALERYRLPTGAASDAPARGRLGRFFRDDDELAGSPSLGSSLQAALDDSRALVVVCSPDSARSKWVDAEIRHFKARDPEAPVLAVIVRGRPDSDDPGRMCFPPSLLRRVGPDGEPTDEPDEPLAPDVSREPFNRLIARLVAGLLRLDFDTLWQRERRRIRRRRVLSAVAAVATVAVSTIGVLEYRAAAREARDSARMAAVRDLDVASRPMIAAAILREVESPARTGGWMQAALDTLAAAQASEAAVMRGHGRDLLSARMGPAGRRVITASMDGTARIWSPGTADPPRVLGEHDAPVLDAGLGPAGERAWTVSEAGVARVWPLERDGDPTVLANADGPIQGAAFGPAGARVLTRTATGARIAWLDGSRDPVELDGGGAEVAAARFSPDGERVLLRTRDPHGARLWTTDAAGGPVDLDGHEAPVHAARFAPAGELAVTASADGTVRLWNARTGAARGELRGHAAGAMRVAFGPKGKRLAVLAGDGTVHLWSLADTGESKRLAGRLPERRWRDLAFADDGAAVVAAAPGQIVRWRLADAQGPERIALARDSTAASMRFVRDGTHVLVASHDDTATLWRLHPGAVPERLDGHANGVHGLHFSATGERLLSVADDATVRIQAPARAGSPVVLDHDRPVYRAAFDGDADRVVTLTDPGWFGDPDPPAVRLWRYDGDPQAAVVYAGEAGRPVDTAVAPGGDRVAIATRKELRLWTAAAGMAAIDAPAAPSPRVAFGPGSNALMAAAGRTVRIWHGGDIDRAPDVELAHPASVTAAAFAPGGARVVTAAADDVVRLWSFEQPAEPLLFRGHDDRVASVAVSPGGDTVASASFDGTARVWPVEGGGSTLVLEHEDRVKSVAFGPEGRRLLTTTGSARPEPIRSALHPADQGPAGGEPGTLATLGARMQTSAVSLWQLEGNGEPGMRLWRQTGAESAAFAPSGRRIATGAVDGAINLWPVRFERIRALLWSLTADCLSVAMRRDRLGFERDRARNAVARCRERVATGP